MTDLTLPEAVFVLAHSPSGRPDTRGSIVEPLVAAAVLGELYLAERIELDQDGVAVLVRSSTPTGDPLLDGVLARMAESNAHSPVEWLAELASGVTAEVVDRLRERGVCTPDEPDGVRWLYFDVEADLRGPTREALASALNRGDVYARAVVLAMLLVAAGLEAAVAPRGTRRRLRELAEDDWLAVSLRSYEGYLINVHRGTTERVYSPPEPRVNRRRRVLYCLAIMLIGAAICAAPLVQQYREDANARSLRDRGEPVMAEVVARSDHRRGRYEDVVRSKLTLGYWYADRSYRAPVSCMGTCPAMGERTRIMVDASQPRVLLTEWGEFTDASPGNDMGILIGGVVITIGVIGAAGVLMPEGRPRLSRPRRR